MMTKKKQSYEGPECEVFEVQMKEGILGASDGINSIGGDNVNNDDEGYTS